MYLFLEMEVYRQNKTGVRDRESAVVVVGVGGVYATLEVLGARM